MKIQSIMAIVSSALLAVNVAASEVGKADKALKTNLKQAINQRNVDIDVDEGIVTLEGEVRTEEDRQAINDIVRSTPGVAAVKNKLKVKFPSPGTATYPPSIPPAAPGRVPIYTKAPPSVTTTTVVTPPPPVIVPDYPKLKIQASTEDDLALANKIARQLRPESFPASGLDNVTITVRDGVAIVQGFTDSKQTHDALIASLQTAGGMTAIYDQLQTK